LVPLVRGGDHSIAVGTAAGVAAHFQKQSKRVGMIWLDAHGDMNTPDTSPSGNVHGMPLASIMGFGPPELTGLAPVKPMIEPHNVALVGVREIDSKERRFAKESGVHVFTMRDIDERGMRDVMSEALRFAGDDTAGIAVSLDMDFVDPSDAPGVGTPVRGGVTYREAHLALEMIADSRAMVSFELVEINPVIDLHNTTAILGVELVLSGLGKKIL
jgi:arginase